MFWNIQVAVQDADCVPHRSVPSEGPTRYAEAGEGPHLPFILSIPDTHLSIIVRLEEQIVGSPSK